jgi:ABC-type amino acid transport substrate-binding protein
MVLVATSLGSAHAAESARPLIVGAEETPPFSYKRPDGSWTGISLGLWSEIAAELGREYQVRQFDDVSALLEAVKTAQVDAAVAALTVTPERERTVDFSHPFYTTGFGIATSKEKAGALRVMQDLFSEAFVKAVGALVLLLFAVGTLLWIFERKRNPQQFGGDPARGLGSAFWWSAVTMTTVGYGDKAPVTFLGRSVAIIWMFASIVLISGFTGAIASALTVGQLAAIVSGPEDLPKVRVGTVTGTTSEDYLKSQRLNYRAYTSTADGLAALAAHEIDAMVSDAPLLRYHVNESYAQALQVLPNTFGRQDYAIALPSGSPLRESLNQTLEAKIREPIWYDTLYLHLGRH